MVNKASPRTSTIPFTPTASGWTYVQPRPLGSIGQHPSLDTVQTPALPSPLRPSIFHTNVHGIYRLSTHLVPAAYPRLIPDIPLPVIPTYIPGEPPSERRTRVEAAVKEVQEIQDTYAVGQLGGKPSEKLLWNCVNRYVRTSARSSTTTDGTGTTLFLAHANGFHKETWETMIRNLFDTPAGGMVDEVWVWEAVQHGDAALLNVEHQSGIFDWLDNARDITNFLLNYLPENVEAVLPTRLQRQPTSVAKAREERGYATRKLVVVGHSFGGCTSLRVAIDFPKLFSSFVLVDPVILRPGTYRPGFIHTKVLGAFSRRDRWSSREEALQSFKKSPFFGAWNAEVLQHYVDYALVDDPDGGVTLKMTKIQEALSFANRVSPVETWELLEKLDETIALRWVVPEQPLSTVQGTYERVWRRPANSTNVMFHLAGHLIVQEVPFDLAQDIADFLLRKDTKARL